MILLFIRFWTSKTYLKGLLSRNYIRLFKWSNIFAWSVQSVALCSLKEYIIMYCNKPVCENGSIVVAQIGPVVGIDLVLSYGSLMYMPHKLSDCR